MLAGLDTETTGLPDLKKPADAPGQPRICQLGLIVHDENRRVRAEVNLIIKPDGWEISEELAQLHGIDQATALKYGIGIKSALALFARLIKTCPTVVAHNSSFDRFLLHGEVLRAGLPIADFVLPPTQLYCTMRGATNIVKAPPTQKMRDKGMTGYKNPNLQECYTHFFGAPFEGAHDAMADVRACLAVYYKIQEANLGKQ